MVAATREAAQRGATRPSPVAGTTAGVDCRGRTSIHLEPVGFGQLWKRELPALALGGGVLATAVYLSRFDLASGPVLCPLRRFTGIPCPFCGMTTSFSHFAGGRIGQAFLASPGGFVLFIATVIGVVTLALLVLSKRRIEVELSSSLRKVAVIGAWVSVAFLFVYQNFRIGPLRNLLT